MAAPDSLFGRIAVRSPRSRFIPGVLNPAVVIAMLLPVFVMAATAGALIWLFDAESGVLYEDVDIGRRDSFGVWLLLIVLITVAAAPFAALAGFGGVIAAVGLETA